jgi:hypothetical protein
VTREYIPPPEWYPPIDEEPLGMERAQELLAYLKQKAPKAAAFAREWLEEHYPGQAINNNPQSVRQLAQAVMTRKDSHLYIGQMSVGQGGMAAVQVMFLLDRVGRISLSFRRLQPSGQRSWSTIVAA